MLRVETINALEDFLHLKKRATLDAIGREASEQTVDIFVRGFLRQVLERIHDLCPDLRPNVIVKTAAGDPVRYDSNRMQSNPQ